MYYSTAKFLKSAQKLAQCPRESRIEIAFAGRSNAGKSSALNTITRVKGLAKTSKTPGRTQLINFFALDNDRFLVDLPGYGYAKVSHSIQKEWEKTLSAYIEKREQLRGLFLIMDIRHPLTEYDQFMLNWVTQQGLQVHILLTKSDKLNRGPAMSVLQQVRYALSEYGELVSVQLFSALNNTGVDVARKKLDEWFTV